MNTIDFGTQRCEKIRRYLDAYLSNELLVETAEEVARHLELCGSCAKELESRARLRDSLRRAVRNEPAPAELLEKAHKRLGKIRPARPIWSMGSMGAKGSIFRGGFYLPKAALALASLAILLIAGLAGQRRLADQQGRRTVAQILSLGVEDHVICAVENHGYLDAGRPSVELRAELGPDYEDLLDLVEQRLPGFEVLEAHQCSPDGKRNYVHFIASGRDTILSVVLTRRDGESLPERRSLVADVSDGINLYKAHLEGMSVAGFEANDYFGFVVSDRGQSEVLSLAASLAPAIRRAVPSMAALENGSVLEVEAASLVERAAR